MSVAEAVDEAARDLAALEGGLVSRVTVHAIDAAGEHSVAAVNAEAPLHHWLWHGGDAAAVAASGARGFGPNPRRSVRRVADKADSTQPMHVSDCHLYKKIFISMIYICFLIMIHK